MANVLDARGGGEQKERAQSINLTGRTRGR